jgi:hypothetical protein
MSIGILNCMFLIREESHFFEILEVLEMSSDLLIDTQIRESDHDYVFVRLFDDDKSELEVRSGGNLYRVAGSYI